MTTTETDRAWSDGDHRDRRAWTGPVAAALGLVLAVLAVFAIVKTLTSSDDGTHNAAPVAPSIAPAAAGDSICGLTSGEPGQPVTSAPDATWLYEGTTAYPTSPQNGPGATATAGYRYCFPHSTEGALFAAANFAAIPSTATGRTAWLEYAMGQGPGREVQLKQLAGSGNSTRNDVRGKIVGFRILGTTDDTARVDLAMEINTRAQTAHIAAVYSLAWEDGDWRVSGTDESPFVFTSIPDTSGYTPWGP